MFSHIAALGSRFRDGVRGGGIGSSEREAIQSSEGRLVVGKGCGLLRELLVVLLSVSLRSICRLFWNQIVTDFVSL